MSLRAEVGADTRYGLRGFKRTPGLTIVTLLTLAVGLGATAAIFSMAASAHGLPASVRRRPRARRRW